MLGALLVFLLAAALDVAYVFYIHWSERGFRHRSALASVAVGALGLIGAVFVVEDPRLIVVDLAGLYLGTWLAVWLRVRLARRRKLGPGRAVALAVRLPAARRLRPGRATRRPGLESYDSLHRDLPARAA